MRHHRSRVRHWLCDHGPTQCCRTRSYYWCAQHHSGYRLGGALAGITGIFISPLICIIAIVYTVIVQQVVYTFISPKLMSNSVDIHPALVILALMIGSALGWAMSGFIGSFIGMLLSIPLAAAAKSIFVYYFEKKTGRSILDPEGVFFKGDSSDTPNPLADATGEMAPVRVDSKNQKH